MESCLETRDLTLITAIAEGGGLGPAARQLHVSPSAASHHLARLEAKLEVRLFERRRRGLVATAAGKELLRSARRLLTDLAEAEAKVRGTRSAARIRVATQCLTGYYWLPAVMAAFMHEHTGVEISIGIEHSRDPIDGLRSEDLDVAITNFPPRAGFATRELFADELALMLPPTHPLLVRKRIYARHLVNEIMISHDLPDEIIRTIGAQVFGDGPRPSKLVRIPVTEAIVEMVKAGHGVTLLPVWSVQPQLDNGSLVARRIWGSDLRRRWVGVYRGETALAPAIEEFLASICGPRLAAICGIE